MNRFGINYFPDETHYTQADAELWLPKIRTLGASWLTLFGSLERAIPEPFLRAVRAADLEPVIHLRCSPLDLETHATLSLFRSYAEWGVQFIILADRPNMQEHWAPSAWGHPSFIEGYVDRVLPILQQASQIGLQPVLPPLEPGGDYWDLAFLEASLQSLQRRAGRDVVRQLVQGVYLWTYGNDPDWGIGGPTGWPENAPYATPPGAQDQCGMRLFEWYAAISERVLGTPMRMLSAGGGPGPDVFKSERLEEDVPTLLRWMSTSPLPDELLNISFSYALAAEGDSHQAIAWFDVEGSARDVVEKVRRRRVADAKLAAAKMPDKPIRHYLLVPADAELSSLFTNPEILALIERVRPTIGHSIEEARRADEVTLVASPEKYPSGSLEKIQAAGCQVAILTDSLGQDAQMPTPDLSLAHQVSTGVSHG